MNVNDLIAYNRALTRPRCVAELREYLAAHPWLRPRTGIFQEVFRARMDPTYDLFWHGATARYTTLDRVEFDADGFTVAGFWQPLRYDYAEAPDE